MARRRAGWGCALSLRDRVEESLRDPRARRGGGATRPAPCCSARRRGPAAAPRASTAPASGSRAGTARGGRRSGTAPLPWRSSAGAGGSDAGAERVLGRDRGRRYDEHRRVRGLEHLAAQIRSARPGRQRHLEHGGARGEVPGPGRRAPGPGRSRTVRPARPARDTPTRTGRRSPQAERRPPDRRWRRRSDPLDRVPELDERLRLARARGTRSPAGCPCRRRP